MVYITIFDDECEGRGKGSGGGGRRRRRWLKWI